MTFTIPENDHGQLYVFDLPSGLAASPQGLATALGLDSLNPDYVDVVARADIAERGAAWYLKAGYDIDLTPQDAARLEGAAAEHLLIVLSRAFGGLAAELQLPAGMTHLATLAVPGMAPSLDPLESAAAKGHIPATDMSTPEQDERPSSRVWLYALIVIFGFFALMAWRVATGNV